MSVPPDAGPPNRYVELPAPRLNGSGGLEGGDQVLGYAARIFEGPDHPRHSLRSPLQPPNSRVRRPGVARDGAGAAGT